MEREIRHLYADLPSSEFWFYPPKLHQELLTIKLACLAVRLSITGFAWTTHNSVEEGTAKVRLAMTGLPLDEAKKPHSRHTRSQVRIRLWKL